MLEADGLPADGLSGAFGVFEVIWGAFTEEELLVTESSD